MDDPHHHTYISFLTKGSQVEVSSNEDGFNGAWYVATVIHPPTSISSPNHHTRNNLVYVEYHNLLSEEGSSNRLREYANISYVRPSPAPDSNPPNFQLNDLVDAFYRDGWWTGVITTVVDSSNFVVTFRNPPDEIQFHFSDLRIHKEWVGGRWVQPQKQVTAGWMFSVGKKVEVSFDRESLRDVWFPATVLKSSGNSTFLVEYQQRGAGDEVIVHKVTVDYHHIRPSPPHLRDKKFVLLEKVDAYYDFGWWCGVVTKELADNRYNVFFKHTKKEQEFTYSKVRPHMEWKGGKWFNISQGDTAGKTTHSLINNQIEQATPRIGKQTPVATSMMTRKRQTNLHSDEKTSTNDKIVNDDSSKKKEHPSVGQFEGFDSEVSGMSDQAFSNTENLSHGKEVYIKQGKGIELKAPTIDSSKKRGRLTNELKSLQALMKGSEVDLVKRRTQEIVEKKDATKDFLFVVMGLQCNRMTTSQENMFQKPPDEKTPYVAKEGIEGDAASVSLKRKRGRPPKLQALSPKTPVTVNHETGSSVTSTLSVVEAGERKEVGLTTSSGTKSLEENQTMSLEENHGLTNEQPVLAGKHNKPLINDKLPNESTGKDLHVQSGQRTKRYTTRKGKRAKRWTEISINAESPAQVFGVDSQDASKEQPNGSLEKESTTEASIGKSLETMPNDQPISGLFEGKHSSMDGPEVGTVEQSSKAIVGWFDSGSLPFIRSKALWQTLESMEAFRMFPQKPHFRPLLEGVRDGAREGLAIGTMVTFSTVVDKTCSLRFEDPRSTIEDCLETLVELENNGFDVEVIRERLTGLLLIKDKQEELEQRSKGAVEKIEEHNIHGKKTEEEIEKISRQIGELEERRKQTLLKKEKRMTEIGAMEAVREGIEQEIREVGAEFNGLAAAPLVV